jgi:hypothetical protein
MNINHLYLLFEENMMKSLNLQTHISPPPLYFLFYFFEISEIFQYKTPDLEYVNFATPCRVAFEPKNCQHPCIERLFTYDLLSF